jgi:DNA repair ATPase RecN
MQLRTLSFSILSEAVNEAFETEEEGGNDTDVFWDRFSDSCSTTWGDASYTLVKSEVVFDAIAEVRELVDHTAFLVDEFDEDEQALDEANERLDLFDRRCEKLQGLVFNGPELFDLEG